MKAVIEITPRGAVFPDRAQVEAAESRTHGRETDHHLSFESARLLFSELKPDRIDLLEALCRCGPCSVYALLPLADTGDDAGKAAASQRPGDGLCAARRRRRADHRAGRFRPQSVQRPEQHLRRRLPGYAAAAAGLAAAAPAAFQGPSAPDHWRWRFVGVDGLDFIQTEHLCPFGGQPGFALGQGLQPAAGGRARLVSRRAGRCRCDLPLREAVATAPARARIQACRRSCTDSRP